MAVYCERSCTIENCTQVEESKIWKLQTLLLSAKHKSNLISSSTLGGKMVNCHMWIQNWKIQLGVLTSTNYTSSPIKYSENWLGDKLWKRNKVVKRLRKSCPSLPASIQLARKLPKYIFYRLVSYSWQKTFTKCQD